ncbi:hypothetical protein ACSQ67_002970 [Phaseolus vulgaris]
MLFSAVTVKSAGLPLFSSFTPNSHLRPFPNALCTHHDYIPSQRVSSFSQSKSRRTLVHDPRKWVHPNSDDDDDENDEDRSLDLLVRFVQNVFKKVSKRTRKAVRSVLPFPISTHLIGFSVNGTLLLAFLWILKAFLQHAMIKVLLHSEKLTFMTVKSGARAFMEEGEVGLGVSGCVFAKITEPQRPTSSGQRPSTSTAFPNMLLLLHLLQC